MQKPIQAKRLLKKLYAHRQREVQLNEKIQLTVMQLKKHLSSNARV